MIAASIAAFGRSLTASSVVFASPAAVKAGLGRKLGIQKEGGGKGFPKLTDAYRHFSGRPMEGAHTSLVDAKACLVVMHGLMRLGALPEPKVHYAKNPPQRDTAA